jgi:hypothetical protein
VAKNDDSDIDGDMAGGVYIRESREREIIARSN